jgi:TonB family protein
LQLIRAATRCSPQGKNPMSLNRFVVALLLGSALPLTAFAQSTDSKPADESPTDRAKRQAENPLKWIMMLDDKPRQPAKPAAAEQGKRAPAPAANRGGGSEAAAAAAPRVVAAPVSAPVPAPAPAPAPVVIPAATVAAVETAAAIAPAIAAPAPEIPEPLKLITQVAPELSRDVINKGLRRGNVKVKFNVLPDGSVADIEIMSSSDRALNKSVLAAVQQWKYAPVKRLQQHGAEVAFNLDQ